METPWATSRVTLHHGTQGVWNLAVYPPWACLYPPMSVSRRSFPVVRAPRIDDGWIDRSRGQWSRASKTDGAGTGTQGPVQESRARACK